MKKRKLWLFGHIKRHPGSLEKIIMEGQVEGKRSAGRPHITWEDSIKTWSGMRSITIAGALARTRTAQLFFAVTAQSCYSEKELSCSRPSTIPR